MKKQSTHLLLSLIAAIFYTTGFAQQTIINGPTGSGEFGKTITVLPNGNYVVTDPLYDEGATADVGAVYLYNGVTHALISTLKGSTAGDRVGGTGIISLSNGNYLVRSNNWDNGAATDAGAVTWGSGTSGVSGVVSSSNSLVGSTANDQVGSTGIVALTNGNYLIRSNSWDNGTATDAGAVTWGSAFSGVTGVVSSSNSLVGSTANDQIGSTGITALSNGNYVVRSGNWDNGAIANAGAVTWGNGSSGVSGVVSSSNSLVGSTANDQVGNNGITVLNNGNYVVRTANWDNGAIANAGAVTWGNGTSGVSGVVSSSNSLVGSRANDQVGNNSITALTNGNYVVASVAWDNGTIADAGAVTWGNGSTGTSGVVSSTNSLVGGTAIDNIGRNGITALSNGNYVVMSPSWDNGAVTNVGAVTWGNGSTGTSGVVSSSNSLVGSTANDQIGSPGITALSNGNYVVGSASWDNGTATDAGAVTWCNGGSGTSGVVSSSNSLVGSKAFDQVGINGITALSNGNYVVQSNYWDNGAVTNVGAVTWGNGSTGTSGVVSSSNSLVGSIVDDAVGSTGITVLNNGNYVVRSTNWDNDTALNAGAVTWGNGTSGTIGVVSSSNSLVGTVTNEKFGSNIYTLTNGNYVIQSSTWDNGTVTDAGAVTWCNGSAVTSGVVNSSNSLVGSTTNDQVGSFGITVLSNGNYVVRTVLWDNGTASNAGAVTWCNGSSGTSGVVSSSNSLVGSTASDGVGTGITALSNGNYVVRSSNWDNGTASNAGAVTWCNGSSGTSGVVSSTNSLVGSTTNDQVGGTGIVTLTNGDYVVRSNGWDNGTATDAGAVTWGNGSSGTSGVVSSSNSLVGSATTDQVGSTGITALSNGSYVVQSNTWDNGAVTNAGAVTMGKRITGVSGFINACNSVTGAVASGTLTQTYNTVYGYLIVGLQSESKVIINNSASQTLANHLDAMSTNINGNASVELIANAACRIIGNVTPNGASPVSGVVNAKAWIENTQPSNFVKRHSEITPATNAATATGRVTLYFTQQEFDDFNAVNIIDLPTGADDATGKANLRIEKYPGVSSDGTGLPASYTGTPVLINPTDTDIIWNAIDSRWEISFDVTGFSGFFVKTLTGTLPVKWISVNANLNNSKQAVINWKVQEANVADYAIQKSVDGINFLTIGTVNSKGDGENSYVFTDASALTGKAQYRIQQMENDGKKAYSRIMLLNVTANTSVTLYPNPTADIITISSNGLINTTATLVDVNGRVLQTIRINQNNMVVDMSNYAKGIYMLQIQNGETIKLVKQ